eukprot:129113-Pleurochrysis_carterae.AAC.2
MAMACIHRVKSEHKVKRDRPSDGEPRKLSGRLSVHDRHAVLSPLYLATSFDGAHSRTRREHRRRRLSTIVHTDRIFMYGWTMLCKWGHSVATLLVTNRTIRHTRRMSKLCELSCMPDETAPEARQDAQAPHNRTTSDGVARAAEPHHDSVPATGTGQGYAAKRHARLAAIPACSYGEAVRQLRVRYLMDLYINTTATL